MKIIIVGCGKVGSALAESLSKEDHDITVIDIDRDVINQLTNTVDIIGVEGNGASLIVQKEAGITEAEILIATTVSDEVNMLCCLIAKKSNKDIKTIVRVRNPIYLDEVGFFREELGLTMVINPERAAAREIARLLRFPSAMKIDTLSGGRVELLKFRIEKGSPLDGEKIMNLSQEIRNSIQICSVERGDEVFIANGSTELKVGDRVSFLASPLNASNFFKTIHIETHAVKDTMIIGGSKLAYYLSKMLLDAGIDVKIIERDRARCMELDEALEKATVINGDGTEETVIMEEGLEKAQSIVALTNIDEENILLSLYAKKHNEKAKIVTKVNRMMFDSIVEEIDIGTIVHTRSIVVDIVAGTVRAMQNSQGRSKVETLVNILDGKAEALELVIREDSEVTDVPLQELKLKDNLIVACIRRRNNIIYPRGGNSIKVGDRVVIVTTHQGLNDITDILGEKR
ncbi:MAG: Trk system potassium transporter TrkA [Lachnospiraceae bacterium]|nr:Trk system potassium transporter TrkA [Lachnospiraceae bacterium]MBR1522843.1 Trk system potassium transporter TrkA [Lachnospiraceae bacterium]